MDKHVCLTQSWQYVMVTVLFACFDFATLLLNLDRDLHVPVLVHLFIFPLNVSYF